MEPNMNTEENSVNPVKCGQSRSSNLIPAILSLALLVVGIVGYSVCTTLQHNQKTAEVKVITITNNVESITEAKQLFDIGALCGMATVIKMKDKQITEPTNTDQYLDQCLATYTQILHK